MAFHVPEAARWTTAPYNRASTADDGNNGAFRLASPEPGWTLLVIASDGGGWEHVSVHAVRRDGKSRTPSWKEMAFVKQQFWEPDDVVVQFYPREADYVNRHPHTLHWWRPIGVTLPTPARLLV